MFNNSTGFQIHGGNYINVSGDVNLETHQHLMVQDRSLHDARSTFALESGSTEGYDPRELSGAARNMRHGMGARQAPYAVSSRPPLLLRGSTNPEDHANVHSGPLSSAQPRLDYASGFNQPATTSAPPPSIDWFPSSNSEPIPPLDFHPGNMPDPGDSLTNPYHTIPLNWDRDRWSANFARGRQVPDDRPSSFHHEIGYDSHQNHSQAEPPGGTIINTQNVNHRSGETGIQILHRVVALEALHDSAESFPQPRCHPETRKEILDGLYNWAVADAFAYSIRWLHGPAGAGKSAIMQTLCQRLREAGHLGGAFFFKRGHATRGNAKVLFATLAYQLALHPSRQLNAPISRSAETDPSVVGRGMDVQLYSLIVEPCKLLRDPAPLVLLIDGLDECEGLNVQQEILRLIASIAHNRSLRLRFLIASRPEAHIREEFEEDSFQELYDSVNVEQSFEDIRTYLRDEFTRIHHEHRHTMGNTLTPWPSPATLEALVIKSSGYFIYASTIIRFIDDKGFRPTKRLESIQKLSSDDSDSPFAALDQLYFQILSSAPDSSHSNLCDILCAVANFRLSSKDIDLLLGLDADDTELILRNLHSVLSMGSTLYPVITVHHASILDFLHDHKRSSTFYIDAHRRKLAHAVLKTLAYTYEDQQLNHQLNRAPDPLPWRLGQGPWLELITSVPSSPDLVARIQLVNPDFLPWGSKGPESFAEQINRFVVWLREIQPVPHRLIQRWEDFRFMEFYISCARPNAKPLAPSLHMYRGFQSRMNTEFKDMFEACRGLFSRSPQLIRICQAIRLGPRIPTDSHFYGNVFNIRFLLNLSPDEITTSLCSLRPIIGWSPRKLCALLMCLPILCQEFEELYPEALISTELACGSIRLIQHLGDRDLPIEYWPRFSPYTGFESLEWGRHIRSSPESSPELLHHLRHFVPPWDVFVKAGEQLPPNEFYDVVQWLKASPDPQLDLIERWQGYLAESMDRWGKKYSDNELEVRWQKGLKEEARFHGPLQPSDEGVIRCWESVLKTINRKAWFNTQESDDGEGESSDEEEGLRNDGEEEFNEDED